MFERSILDSLTVWRNSPRRKPLVIRGARQTGKTSAVHLFGRSFKHYLYFNLERAEDREVFIRHSDFNLMVQALLLSRSVPKADIPESLLFLDEIQTMPDLISQFRYFFEELPELAVIGAGSLLETLFTENQPFPVGRVEYKMVRPLSFGEFLAALGEEQALEAFHKVPLPVYAETKLFQLFHLYAIIGGMPKAVQCYIDTRDLVQLRPVYDALLLGYQDDAEKYSGGKSQTAHLRFVLKTLTSEAGRRIRFEGFGKGPYKSREIGEALRLLEKAFLIQLVYPCTEARIPLVPDYKKSPRLQFLDSGLLSYANGYQQDLLGTNDLSKHFQGLIIEHLVGQEIQSVSDSPRFSLQFWVRDKITSSAEVDYLLSHNGRVIPVEVKSGPAGRLKSLFLVAEQFQLPFAIRLYAGHLHMTEEKTPLGHSFKLLHLPYFLASRIQAYTDCFSSAQ